ncbi:hypothetical protein MTR67_027267 [Solanum verrucosum]|uniref:Uncharacterized protein n=1 Tax=Solanum verrucosum TaxID=315347 RepID=A0AAF0R0F4_SOLVR|nr:hypothetical protein MTR67_027267 [Solanum verrucosum]
MISVIAHEIAELSTNPLVNAWYAGEDPSFPVEIADLCEGIYGSGGGGSYTGQMLNGEDVGLMHLISKIFICCLINVCRGLFYILICLVKSFGSC